MLRYNNYEVNSYFFLIDVHTNIVKWWMFKFPPEKMLLWSSSTIISEDKCSQFAIYCAIFNNRFMKFILIRLNHKKKHCHQLFFNKCVGLSAKSIEISCLLSSMEIFSWMVSMWLPLIWSSDSTENSSSAPQLRTGYFYFYLGSTSRNARSLLQQTTSINDETYVISGQKW